MSAVPYRTHVEIAKAIAPYTAPIRAALIAKLRRMPLIEQLKGHAAKLRLDTAPTIWYYKGTPVEIAYSRSEGFILLDHVRKLRSPGMNSLADATRARAHTLKEHENAPSDDATADRDQAEV